MKTKVLVSVPNTGWIHKLVTFAVIRMIFDSRVDVVYIAPTWTPYEHSMNRIAVDFLKGPYDYWLSIDSDNPPLGDPLARVNSGYDVVGFPTPVWRDDCKGIPLYWNAMVEQSEGGYLPANVDCVGLQKRDAVGSGCILFSRNVVQGVKAKYGVFFERSHDKDGIVEFGADFLFCKRAIELGFKIAADYDCPCDHFVETSLMTAAQRYEEMIHGSERCSMD